MKQHQPQYATLVGQNCISTGLNRFIDRRKTVGAGNLLLADQSKNIDWFESKVMLKQNILKKKRYDRDVNL